MADDGRPKFCHINGAGIMGLPSQIAYGGRQKIRHAIYMAEIGRAHV